MANRGLRHRLKLIVAIAAIADFALYSAPPSLSTEHRSAAAPDARQVRADFGHLVDRPRVPLMPTTALLPCDAVGLELSRVELTSEPAEHVPALVMEPSGPVTRRAVVIVLHGTGGRKEDELDMLHLLARAGFVAVAPDGRYHGQRCPAGHGTTAYYAAIAQAYRDGRGHPWLYDTVFDVTRLIDYLQTRPGVDPARIGLMGFSKGGMETYLAAAVDPRVAAAAPCIAVQSFRWELDHGQWHGRIGTVQGAFDTAAGESHTNPSDPAFVQRFYDRVVPGIDGEFDCPALLPLICPRPLLAVNGEDDPINPLPGARIAADAAEKAYAAAGVPKRFEFVVEPGVKHDVNALYRRQIVAWFGRTLATPPKTRRAAGSE